MRRAVLVVAVVVAIASLVPLADAGARGRTFVNNTCRHLEVRPRYILFACGDGAFYVRQMEWGTWHRFRATGHGVFHQNDCDPSCAGGTFHAVRGRLLLKHPVRCRHHYAFGRASITFEERFLGRRRVRTKIPCP